MNFPFKRILCPVGFDDQEGAVIDAAKQLAGSIATIYLLHVVPALPAIGEPDIAKTVKDEKPSEAQALKTLKELAAQRLSGLKFETLTETAFLSDTAKAVLTVAQDIKPDLIVMSTHGGSSLKRLFMGSVTDGVIRESPCPVLTIRPSAS
ncbi:MAG TPA: universal stress protein [Candidatus Binataceae bacterium]|nr:universal stress protein [Candidatus Binataceae bacterium]